MFGPLLVFWNWPVRLHRGCWLRRVGGCFYLRLGPLGLTVLCQRRG